MYLASPGLVHTVGVFQRTPVQNDIVPKATVQFSKKSGNPSNYLEEN